jgi:3-hydroxyacyl-CoA dehydrogenase/enoyl-CoA hydratase/3-hydroxybutyryl-CoA epimerase
MESPRLELGSDGIAWIVFDDPNAKVNLLNPDSVGQLDRILDELSLHRPQGIVFISGKPDVFIAGADIKELEKIRDAAQAENLSRAGHRIFAKIERLGVPSVAAIDGACLGGGCELALACQHRVATDNPKTQIGLPETQLGIIPGWGGTQRLPRLIGLRAALGIVVAGKSVSATRALKLGLVDAVVPAVALRAGAKKLVTRVHRAAGAIFLDNVWPVRKIIGWIARRQTLAKTHGHYPAPLKAIDAMEQGLGGSLERGLDVEARLFAEVATTSQCKNLIRVFFLREKYSKLRLKEAASASKIEKVGVLGAGVMGAGIAQWCSARGLTVRLKDIKPEFVAAGVKRIADVYRDGLKRHKLTKLQVEHGLARVHPTTDYDGFGGCDLVVEAVLEKIEVKRGVFEELIPLLRADCVIASNTSAIPIDELAEASGRPKRFIGIHFFNPVHKMPLVEIVRGTKTAPEVVASAVEFAKQLKKIPIVVNGAPGFLVNRLLMPYLNEAGVLLGEGVGVEAIDKAMLDFGMPMGPLRLIDEVGIDVAYDVARELAEAFKDRMSVAPALRRVHEQGLKGRKGGKGFYVYQGRKTRLNRDLGLSVTRTPGAAAIQSRLLGVMIAEAKRCLNEDVVGSEDDIDTGMIFGTGFPPFRGGLVKYARDSGLWR